MTTAADLARIAREAREAREREAELVVADAVTPQAECLEPGCTRGPGEAEELAGRARPKREVSRSPWRRNQA